MKYKLVYLLAALISFAACEKRDAIRNGTVDTEIVSPADKASIAKTDEVEVEIKFLSEKNLVETAFVKVNVFTAGKEAIENLESLPIEVGELIVDFNKTSINQSEYVFKQTVDISTYPKGTCFTIFTGATSSSKHVVGIENNSSYFCIE